MKLDKIDIIFLLILITGFTICYQTFKDTQEACEYFQDRDEITYGLNGIYVHDKYYCVWTDSPFYIKYIEPPEDIEKHEVCHHLVYKDSNHFISHYQNQTQNG